MRLSALPVAGALCAALLLSGCTDEPAAPAAFPLPPVGDFAPGTCELVAEDLLELGRAARALGDGPIVEDAVLTRLTEAQEALHTVAGTAEPALAPLLEAVVTRAGLVRLAADTQRYEPSTREPLEDSYAELVRACTGDEPPAASSEPSSESSSESSATPTGSPATPAVEPSSSTPTAAPTG